MLGEDGRSCGAGWRWEARLDPDAQKRRAQRSVVSNQHYGRTLVGEAWSKESGRLVTIRDEQFLGSNVVRLNIESGNWPEISCDT